MTATVEHDGRARRLAGEAREDRRDVERAKRQERRREAEEIAAWVEQRFPVEKRSQATVAFYMLRWIHGRGNVTLAMVKARMRAQDERHGICDQTTSERSTA
jgi:aryl-alcohol dehydrogenase-like predicted oxidoreductase